MSLKNSILYLFFAIAICLLLFYFIGNKKTQKNENLPIQKENDLVFKEENFTKLSIPDFKHIVLSPQIGRVILTIRQYEFPTLEINKDFQPYVNFEITNDTLFIRSIKSKGKSLHHKKQINIYVSELNSVQSKTSQTQLVNFKTDKLNIDLDSDFLRLNGTEIKELTISTKNTCTLLIEPKNIIENIHINLNETSHLKTSAKINKTLTLKTKSLENTYLYNINPNKIKWIRN